LAQLRAVAVPSDLACKCSGGACLLLLIDHRSSGDCRLACGGLLVVGERLRCEVFRIKLQ
jgi:hypothetical protein